MARYKVFYFLFILLLTASTAFASRAYRSKAVIEGIGYRSNLIDPFNEYTNQKKMFRSLLSKYKLIPNDYLTSKELYASKRAVVNGDEYLAQSRSLLVSEANINNKTSVSEKEFRTKEKTGVPEKEHTAIERLFSWAKNMANNIVDFFASPKGKLDDLGYLYSYGTCETNDYPSALAFIKAASKDLGRSTNTNRLIMARHHMLKICSIEETELSRFLNKFDSILLPLRGKAEYTPWTDYLDGAMYFYREISDESKNKFTAIKGNNTDWVKDTADYMKVRIANNTSYKDLPNEISEYLKLHPKGRYAKIVHNLRRYAFKANHDKNALIAATHLDFISIFSQGTEATTTDKLDFLAEAIDYTGAIFETPKNSDAHPLTIVGQILGKVKNKRSSNDRESSHTWLDRFNNSTVHKESFPGLAKYFDLLFLAYKKDFDAILHRNIHAEDFGPLYPEALILKAHALGKLGRHHDAAKKWLQISLKHPIYNALTEVATEYFNAGQFVNFTRISPSWMTSISNGKEEPHDSTEFEITVKSFYKSYNPYENLLRRGFATAVSLKEAIPVYTDNNLNPIIRFLAAEPTLRSQLLTSNYLGFLKTSKRVFNTEFDSSWNKNDHNKNTSLIVAYRELQQKIEPLILNPDDPDALAEIGYFLYDNDRFPKCHGKTTQWELSIGKCGTRHFESIFTDKARPIDLFLKALSIYKLKEHRGPKEAKLLRTLIYCFKGSRFDRCVRGGAFPKKNREEYFQRLHKYFPKEATRTPYWY